MYWQLFWKVEKKRKKAEKGPFFKKNYHNARVRVYLGTKTGTFQLHKPVLTFLWLYFCCKFPLVFLMEVCALLLCENNNIRVSESAENIYHRRKYHCTVDLLLDWFWFCHTSKAYGNATKAKQPNQNKINRRSAVLPLKFVISGESITSRPETKTLSFFIARAHEVRMLLQKGR